MGYGCFLKTTKNRGLSIGRWKCRTRINSRANSLRATIVAVRGGKPPSRVLYLGAGDARSPALFSLQRGPWAFVGVHHAWRTKYRQYMTTPPTCHFSLTYSSSSPEVCSMSICCEFAVSCSGGAEQNCSDRDPRNGESRLCPILSLADLLGWGHRAGLGGLRLHLVRSVARLERVIPRQLRMSHSRTVLASAENRTGEAVPRHAGLGDYRDPKAATLKGPRTKSLAGFVSGRRSLPSCRESSQLKPCYLCGAETVLRYHGVPRCLAMKNTRI